eukprot:Gb_09697 [translate_table: standard]
MGCEVQPLAVILVVLLLGVSGQQVYENNGQLDCENNSSDITFGYACNGQQRSCSAYLHYRAQSGYRSVAQISALLNSDKSAMAKLNNVSEEHVWKIDDQIIAPVNCSCAGKYSQANATYRIQQDDTYFFIANNTYEGLSACQALIRQNPYPIRGLQPGKNITIPLRCACPTATQARNGVKYLLSYLVTWRDDIPSISQKYNVSEQDTLNANGLTDQDIIYPFTTLLLPLREAPSKSSTTTPPSPPPPPPPVSPSPPTTSDGGSNTGLYIGIGVGVGAFLLILTILAYIFFRRRHKKENEAPGSIPSPHKGEFQAKKAALPEDLVAGMSEMGHALPLYKFEDLKAATHDFSPSCRIRGSVYRGVIDGAPVAIKQMKGDVSQEINILRKINHFNLIRLAGLCTSEDHSYLVYEYAENGSLSDRLHSEQFHSNRSWSGSSVVLSWRQRVQICLDIANGLYYLHNYTNPAYVHKDIKSSNILLDGDYRAKIANFGLAKSADNRGEGFALTRHVVGTKGYMAPEYLSHGLVTPKLDIFSFGVVMLEILSAREAVSTQNDGENNMKEIMLWSEIGALMEGENPKEKVKGLMDPGLQNEYPLDMAFSVAQIAKACVDQELGRRPTINEIVMALSRMLSTSFDWESPSLDSENNNEIPGR